MQENEMVIFPNPSDGVFFVRLEKNELDAFRIYDATGKIVNVRPEFRERDFMVDLRGLGAGVYFIQITQGLKTFTKKLVVAAH